MKRALKFLIALAVGIAIFSVAMGAVGWKTIPEALALFLSFKGLIILLLTLIIHLVGFLKWKFILEKLTKRIDFKGLFKIWTASFPITYIFTPVAVFGGEPFRAYFVKKDYGLDWQKSAASVAIDRFLDWIIMLFLTIVGIFVFLFCSQFASTKILLIATLFIFVLFVLLLFFCVKAFKKESALERILGLFGIKREKIEKSHNGRLMFETEREIIKFFSLKKKIFWEGFLFTVFKYILYFLRVAILIFFIQGGIGVVKSFAIYGVSNIALFFPVPAALGSLEAAGLLSFGGLGFGLASGTIFAMILRGADLILSFVGVFFLIGITVKTAGKKILGFFDKLNDKIKE